MQPYVELIKTSFDKKKLIGNIQSIKLELLTFVDWLFHLYFIFNQGYPQRFIQGFCDYYVSQKTFSMCNTGRKLVLQGYQGDLERNIV